jgi:hypothetical protein
LAAAWQASGTLLGALTTADVTPVIPAHAADDILICITANRVVTNTCSTPSEDGGWTLLHGPIDTTAWRTYVFWKRATSGAMTNPLCDWTATSADKYAQVHTVRGAITTGSPFANSALTGDVTDPIVVPGVSSTAANQLIIVAQIGSDNASASVTVSGTDPSSYTQRHFTTIATGADATGSFHEAVRATAGATGNVTLDHNSTMPAAAVLVAAMVDPVAALEDPFPYEGGGYYG